MSELKLKSSSQEKLTDEWKTWIAYSLAQGEHPQKLREQMVSRGVSPVLAKAEMSKALDHPYVKACQKFQEKLERREWLLSTMHKVAKRAHPALLEIERIEAPPYSDFLKNYYAPSRPVILKNVIKNWEARNWTPSHIREVAGDVEVEVQYKRSKDPLYQAYFNRYSTSMKFSKFIDEVIALSPSNDLYMTSNNRPMDKPGMQALKDDYGQFGDGYFRPKKRGDLWFGPAGTITPIHHDLTNNMFIQVYGRKKIKLVSPFQTPDLYNEFFVYSKVDFSDPNIAKFPNYKNLDVMEFVLDPGDALFLPIGWWHHIESLDISISLTFIEFKGIQSDFHKSFPKPKHILKP